MKHGDFLQFFSDLFRVEKKTVTVVARAIREAGHMTSGARGVNAPDMTVNDAVNLTIALLSGQPPSRVVDALELYLGQVLLNSVDYANDGLLDVINPNHLDSAGEFLEALIRIMAGPREVFLPFLIEELEHFPSVEIQVAEHDQTLSILISTLTGKRRVLEFFDVESAMKATFEAISEEKNARSEQVSSAEYLMGMRSIRSIGTGEILKIAEIFKDEEGQR